eukprot:XP_003723332.1 PREDICTED: THAP domain-containing protein 2 [Strongylocentrotus purpuratus]
MPFCAAFNCTNRLKKGSGITFHRFPKSGSALLKEWLVKMRRDKWIPNKYSTMCSIHFEEVCFDRTGQTTRLREGSIPTIFNFSAHLKEKTKTKKPGRVSRRKQLVDVDSRTDASSDRQSSDQELLINEEPVAGNIERQFPNSESQVNALNNLRNVKQDGILKEDKTKVNKEKQLPDKDSRIRTLLEGHSFIKDGFFYHAKPSPISDISRNERKRINRIKQHDHSYSIRDNPVVLKHRMDVACTKMAEIRAKLKNHYKKNRRLSVKIKVLTREVQELRDGQFAINNTLKFLESLEYRPDFGT